MKIDPEYIYKQGRQLFGDPILLGLLSFIVFIIVVSFLVIEGRPIHQTQLKYSDNTQQDKLNNNFEKKEGQENLASRAVFCNKLPRPSSNWFARLNLFSYENDWIDFIFDWRRINFKGLGYKEKSYVKFSNEKEDFLDFSGIKIKYADIEGVDLTHRIFNKADFMLSNLSNNDFTSSLFDGANLACTSLLHTNFKKAVLSNADLAQSNLTDAILREAILYKTNLSNATLHRADLQGANLAEADFTVADLKYVNKNALGTIIPSVFHKAKLHRADLSNSSLPNALFAGADLEQSKIVYAKLNHANFDPFCDVDEEDNGVKKCFIVNLEKADLTQSQLWGASFKGANLKGAILNNANLRNAQFQKYVARSSNNDLDLE